MTTEIIKVNSFRNNVQAIFANLLSRFKGQNSYDLTLVIKQN